MSKLGILFLLIFLPVLSALSVDNKEPIDVQAQTVVIDESHGLSVYTGNAKLTQGFLMLSADEIQIFSAKHSIVKVIARGNEKKLAHYKQDSSNQSNFIEASALTITYFVNKQIVRLEDNVHFVRGFDSFSAGILHYDIKKDKMIFDKSKDNSQRVKFKIKL